MAAFMLHQATEQILRTPLVIHTGLRLNTHSLDRLARCCGMALPELSDVLPRSTEKERRPFHLLQTACVDARYKDGYCIRLKEVSRLTEKVKALQKVFDRYKER